MVQRVSLTSNNDEWGKDPSVRIMRQVFRRAETGQEEVLAGLQISPFDPRLRGWRKTALELFEQAWTRASRSGLFVDDEEAAALYVQCLLRILVKDGIPGAAGIIPQDERIKELLNRVMP